MKKTMQLFALLGFLLAQTMTGVAQADGLYIAPNGNISTRNKITVGADGNISDAALQVAVPDTKDGIGIDIYTKNRETTSIPLRVGRNKDGHGLLLYYNNPLRQVLGHRFIGGISFAADTNAPDIKLYPILYADNANKDLKNLSFDIANTLFIDDTGKMRVSWGQGPGLLSLRSRTEFNQKYNVRYLDNEKTGVRIVGSGEEKSINISLYATHRIIAKEFCVESDARIKKDYQRSDIQADLTALEQIKITDYRYKYAIQHGTAFKKGVLAQELEQVFPQAVSKHTDYITDIFSMPKQVGLMGTTLLVNMEKPHGLTEGDMVRLITPEAQVDTLVEVLDAQTFMVKNWTRETTSVFVYGKKVDDFRSVDFDRLTVLSISAIQQLCKKAEELKKSVYLLEARANKLEKEIYFKENPKN